MFIFINFIKEIESNKETLIAVAFENLQAKFKSKIDLIIFFVLMRQQLSVEKQASC